MGQHRSREDRLLDVNAFVKFLEEKGGGVYGSRAGQVSSKLANVLNCPPYHVSQFLKRMEQRGIAVIDRGQGGRFIYGVRLAKEDQMKPPVDTNSAILFSPPDQSFEVKNPNASIRLNTTPQIDYSALAARLLEKATDAIAENERLHERVAYLEEKLQERPAHNIEGERHNVIKDLLHQVGQDAE